MNGAHTANGRMRYAVWVVLVGVLGCSSSDEQVDGSRGESSVLPYTAVVTLEKERSINLEFGEKSILDFAKALYRTSSGHFIWVESEPPIYVFDSEGKFLSTLTEYGEGPGELNSISTFSVDRNSNLYIADGNTNRIEIFSSDYRYRYSYRLELMDRSSLSAVNSQGHVIFLREAWYNGLDPAVVVYDNRGKRLLEWGKMLRSSQVQGMMKPSGGIEVDRRDNIYYCYISDHRIWKTDSSGRLLSVFDQKPDYYIAPDNKFLDDLDKKYDSSNPKLAMDRMRHFRSVSRVTNLLVVPDRNLIFQEIVTKTKIDLEVWHTSGFKIAEGVSGMGNVKFIDSKYLYYVRYEKESEHTNPGIDLYSYSINSN